MSEKGFGKLVRDGIPEVMEKNGKKLGIRRLKGVEFFVELKEKLVEEANEVANANTRTEIIEELADLQEVRDALLTVLGATQNEVDKVQAQKRNDVGSFQNHIFLESIQ